MIQNIINSSFETVTNVRYGAEILQSFVHLAPREVILDEIKLIALDHSCTAFSTHYLEESHSELSFVVGFIFL